VQRRGGSISATHEDRPQPPAVPRCLEILGAGADMGRRWRGCGRRLAGAGAGCGDLRRGPLRGRG
jgi:hypothetical protein